MRSATAAAVIGPGPDGPPYGGRPLPSPSSSITAAPTAAMAAASSGVAWRYVGSAISALHAGLKPGPLRDEASGNLLDHLDEAVEHVDVVERPGRGLRVVLDGEQRLRRVPEPLDGAVVQVHLGDLNAAAQAVPVQGVTVVLRGDVDAAGQEVLHRVVGATVAELQLERLRPEGAAQELVAEADAEHRLLADQRLRGGDGVVQERRVAGAGREY